MKSKNKVKDNNLINLDDTSKIDLDNKKIINKKIKNNKQNVNTSKDKKTKTKIIKENKVKKDNNNILENNNLNNEFLGKKNTKSKLNIFLLIICLFIIIFLSYKIYPSLDFSNYSNLIKDLSFILTLLIVVIILFKVNSKRNVPYIVIFTLLLIIYTFFNTSYSFKEIYVEDFINKDISKVIEFTDKYKLKLNTSYEYSDNVLKNHIIMQEYGISTLVRDLKEFNVVVSDGPNYNKEVIISNLIGFKYDEVMTYIKNNFLNNVEISFIKSDKEKDTVIEQIGSGNLKRNDLIKFVFSYGNEELEKVLVKDLKKLSLFEATSYLKRHNIMYEIEYSYSSIDKGYVVNQDIINKIVEDKLKLVISKGKEVIVPDLMKMSNLEIIKWALENKIEIEYVEIFDKESKAGDILKISQSKGDKIDEDSKVIITISKGSMVMPEIKNINEFKLWANENNIKIQENFEFSDTITQGELINCSHKTNDKLTENDLVILTISKGKSVTIPNLVGLGKSNIINRCKNVDLNCTFTYGGFTESTNKDISLKQSKPAGSVVSANTNLLITLSSGIYEKVNVPSFVGKSKSEIVNSCNSLGITCNFNYNNTYSDVNKDTALSQNKTGTVIKGSSINIVLSIGPAKTYTIVIDGSLLSGGNPQQTKNTLQNKLQSACPGVNFNFSFQAVNSGIGYLNQNSQVKVGVNNLVQGKTYNVIINSN